MEYDVDLDVVTGDRVGVMRVVCNKLIAIDSLTNCHSHYYTPYTIKVHYTHTSTCSHQQSDPHLEQSLDQQLLNRLSSDQLPHSPSRVETS